MDYIRIAQRLFNKPLMMDPAKLQVVMNVLAPRIGFDAPVIAADLRGADNVRRAPELSAEREGIRIIDLAGSLVNRYATAPSGTVSYDEIRDDIAAAVKDPNVRGILLRLESYGGEVAGIWDTLDAIRTARRAKPVWAAVDDSAYSAAYAIASQAERISITRTGGAGSIGVIAMHYDFSKRNDRAGIKPTAIYAGKHKNDLSPHQPLSEETRSMLQAMVDREYDRFVTYVAEGRHMDESAVRATEAQIYDGSDAVEAGLVDTIATFEQTLEDFRAELGKAMAQTIFGGSARATTKKEGIIMPDPRIPAAEPTRSAADPQQPVEANDQQAVELTAAEARGFKAGTESGAQSERVRIRAILSSTEAVGRTELANYLAFESDMSAESAVALLKKAPLATASAKQPFEEAMEKLGNPKVGAPGMAEEDEDAAMRREMVTYGNRMIGVETRKEGVN